MDELEKTLIAKARSLHESIYPCAQKEYLTDCFTVQGNQLFFWFNTKDHSTHVMIEKIAESSRGPGH